MILKRLTNKIARKELTNKIARIPRVSKFVEDLATLPVEILKLKIITVY